jgi:hypothetical protein
MVNKILIGISLGIIAGILDITPMIIQKLPLQADLSAFSMWVVIGFLLSVTTISMPSILKGLLISFLVLLPSAFIIAWDNPIALLPIFIMTTLLGAGLGFIVGKVGK